MARKSSPYAVVSLHRIKKTDRAPFSQMQEPHENNVHEIGIACTGE